LIAIDIHRLILVARVALKGLGMSMAHTAALAAAIALTANGAAAQARDCTLYGDVLTEDTAPYALAQGTNIEFAIAEPLTTGSPSADAGLDVFIDPDRGGCIACHAVTALAARARSGEVSDLQAFGFQGTVGPSLDGVADRYTSGELRLILVDPDQALPRSTRSAKPAYYRTAGLVDVPVACRGRTLLTAGEIEELVAYLMTLKAQ